MSCSKSMAFGITVHPQTRCQRLWRCSDRLCTHKSIHPMFGVVAGPAPTPYPFYHQRWSRSFRPRPLQIQQSNVHNIKVVVLGERGGTASIPQIPSYHPRSRRSDPRPSFHRSSSRTSSASSSPSSLFFLFLFSFSDRASEELNVSTITDGDYMYNPYVWSCILWSYAQWFKCIANGRFPYLRVRCLVIGRTMYSKRQCVYLAVLAWLSSQSPVNQGFLQLCQP